MGTSDRDWIKQQQRAWNTTYVAYPNDWRPPGMTEGRDRAAYTFDRASTGMSGASLNYWYGRNNMPAEYQWGYRTGSPGVSYVDPTGTTTQNYYLDPTTGMVLPLTSDAADAIAGGTAPTGAQLLAGSASPDSNDRVEVPGIYDPVTGMIGSPDPVTVEKRFAAAKAKAYADLLNTRAEGGNTAALTDEERAAMEQQAEQNAMTDMSMYMGMDINNYPKSVAGPLATPEFKAGQIFPTLSSGGPREITPEEARTMNFIRNSGVVPDANNVLAALFNPNVPDDTKRQIMAQAAGAYSEYSIKAPTFDDQQQEDNWYWSWNPIEMAGQVLMKGIMEPLAVAYNDFIIPTYTWSASALPGGPRTATYDEAKAVAPGQMTAAALGPRLGAWAGNTTLPFSAAGAAIEGARSGDWSNWQQLFQGYGNAVINDQASWKDMGDQIYEQAKREAAFVDDYYGSQLSGGIGLVVNILWDPLWLAGPIGKGVRVSHQLGMGAGAIRTAADAARMTTALNRGAAVNRGYDLAQKAVRAAERTGNADNISFARSIADGQEATRLEWLKTASPIEQFADWVVRSKPTASQIMEHDVVRFGGDAQRAYNLSKAESFEEVSLLLRAGLGDRAALDDLGLFSAATKREMEDLQLAGQIDNIASAPQKYIKAWSLLERDLDNSFTELRRLEDEAAMAMDPTRVPVAADRERLLNTAYDRLDEARALRDEAIASGDAQALARVEVEIDAARTLVGDLLFDVHAVGRAVPEEVRVAQREVQRNLEKINSLRHVDHFTVRTPEAIEQAGKEIDELFRRDEMFRLALDGESKWLWGNQKVSFGSPGARLEGMARWREQVRQRKAVRRADQKASHRQGRAAFGEGGWIRETYGRGTNTVSVWKFLPSPIKGASAVAADALTRPLTYAAMETPAGYLTLTKGAFTQQDAEARAMLDNIKMYANNSDPVFEEVSRRTAVYGEARATVEGSARAVTGQQRKDEILGRFLRNAQLNPERAARVLEQDIVMDLARKYRPGGVADKDWYEDIRSMYAHFDSERSDLISQVKSKGYWIDENRQKHMSPYLESQLAQGTPMMDFRRLEGLISRYAKNGTDFGKYRSFAEGVRRASIPYNRAVDDLANLTKGTPEYKAAEKEVSRLRSELEAAQRADMHASRGGGTALWENGLKWYDEFQTLWRAGVLFRLGYSTRNVIDGTVRRIAYDASIFPVLQDAMRGSRNMASNVKAGRVRDDLPFDWMNRAARRRKEKLTGRARASVERGDGLPARVAAWRDREVQRVVSFRDNIQERKWALDNVIDELRAADRSHLSPDEVQRLDGEIMGLVDHSRSLESNAYLLDHKLATLSDDADAVLAYRQSLDTPRRIGDELVFGVDGSQYFGMLSDPRMREIMLKELSAGETVQATLGLSLDIARSVNRAATIIGGDIVRPGAANYYESVAYAVNNFMRNGTVGRLWAQGVDPAEAANRMMRREGERFRQEVGPNYAAAKRKRLEDNLSEEEMAAIRTILEADEKELDYALRQFMGMPAKGASGPVAMLPTELVDEIRQARKDWRKIRGTSNAKYEARDAKADEITALERQLGRRMRDERVARLNAEISQAERELEELLGRNPPIDPITEPSALSSAYVSPNLDSAGNPIRYGDQTPLNVIVGRDTRIADQYRKINELRAQRSRATDERPFAPAEGDAHWFQANGIESYDDVLLAVRDYYADFDRLIPNPQVRRAIANGQVTPDFLRANLDPEDWDLFPVIGSRIDIQAGSGKALSVVEKLNPVINKTYQVLGALPEDTMVRIPFAANVYRKQMQMNTAWMQGAFGDRVPAWAVEQAERNARQVAVRETKRYMYTQDRRTNFGRVMERYIPFISAWQNSVMAYSRMVKMNPEILPWFEQAWRAPDNLGLVDQDGNVRIPMSKAFAPLGYAMGGDELVFRKESLFVLPDQFDPLLTFKGGPVINVAVSNLMQTGLIGPVVPSAVKTALNGMGLSDSQAQQAWDMAARLSLGTDEETGRPQAASTVPLSADRVLPPWMQKGVQFVQSGFGNTPENNVQYATQYSRIIREEMLKYARGEREDMPDRDEIREKTNALYITRTLNNLVGFTAGPLGMVTPPQPDSDAYALQETYRLLVDTVGYDQADEVWVDMFGDEALYLANFRGTKSPGGMPVSIDALARAEEYKDAISAIAGGMDDVNLGMLAYMLSDGTYQNEDYAPDVRAAQLSRNIPGTSVPWREVLTPQEQTREASVNTGWSMYTHTMDAIYAEMTARGLKSLNSAGAADLRKARDEFLERMRTDPLYTQWHDDYQNGGERRIGGALDFMRSVLADDNFMSGPGASDTDMWKIASLWLSERSKYYASIRGIKGMDGYQGNDYASSALRDAWLQRSTMIAETNPRFQQFWVRYLDSDDLTMD